MADNFLYDPELNPVRFFDPDLTPLPAFNTLHFDDYEFSRRGKPWLQAASYEQIWQTSDIINFQWEGSFDPIIVELINENDESVITLPALIGLPNKFYPGTYSFEVAMSLADLETGCYRLKRTLGSSGPSQKIQYSGLQHISSDPIPETILIQYWNSRFFKDVIFETGIKFQLRVPGWIDYDRSGRNTKQEIYRDEKYNRTILSSKSAKSIPVYFGDEFGLPTDITNIIEQIWECDNVLIDNLPFGLSDEGKLDFIDIEGYRMRGLHTTIEPGINRNSRIVAVTTDTTKKLITSIIVDARVFGDTANQGSVNTVPVTNIMTE